MQIAKREKVMGIRSLCIVGKSKEKWEAELPNPNEHHVREYGGHGTVAPKGEKKGVEGRDRGPGTRAPVGEAWDDITGLPLDAEEVAKQGGWR